jgi:hypothetical protein
MSDLNKNLNNNIESKIQLAKELTRLTKIKNNIEDNNEASIFSKILYKLTIFTISFSIIGISIFYFANFIKSDGKSIQTLAKNNALIKSIISNSNISSLSNLNMASKTLSTLDSKDKIEQANNSNLNKNYKKNFAHKKKKRIKKPKYESYIYKQGQTKMKIIMIKKN